jgi:hypothetical protein
MKIKKEINKYIPKQNSKVSLFIVGAQKSGTSALHNYLLKHPDIIGGVKKEINFFNHPEKFEQGINWYHKQYSRPLFYKQKKIYLDSTPQYLSDDGVAKKIHNYNTNAKIIILLREPISRAYSAWNMYKQFSELPAERKESLLKSHIPHQQVPNFERLINRTPFYTFDEYVNKELNFGKLFDYYPNIIKRGIYKPQLKPYIDLFGFENVMIYESEYFKNNKLEVTNTILEKSFLDPLRIDTTNLKPVHSRVYESFINDETEEKLKDFYKPYNEELFQLINQKFDW